MKDKIGNYIRAGYPLLQITSHEEMRVVREIDGAVEALNASIPDESKHYSVYTWTITGGIQKRAKTGTQSEEIPESQDPFQMATAFAVLPDRSILVALDYHFFTADCPPTLIRCLKECFEIGKSKKKHILLIGCTGKIVPELQKYITLIEFKLPDRVALNVVVKQMESWCGVDVTPYRDALLDAASGLTTVEAEDAFSLAFIESGKLSIPPHVVAREKAQTVQKNGILEIVDTPVNAESIGGLSNLKGWLNTRKHAFTQKAKDFGLPTVKGCLAVGVPGTGKSLSAKAAAAIFGVPLLKLDAGRIFGSLVGQSEANLRSVIETAEAIAPCVLWIDECERALSGSKSNGQSDGGTGDRVFGKLLDWMNEKTAPVFIFATANDVSQLPPQFLRKGRLDQLWTVDIPTHQERAEIIAIQTKKHKRAALFSPDDIQAIVKATPQFTGAEIEATFNEALYTAFDSGREVTTADVIESASNLIPLAVTMKDQVKAMQEWGKGRARPATATIAESAINNIRSIMEN